MRKKKPRGFTLIELLCVVAIMGVLFAIAIPHFAQLLQGGGQSAREAAQLAQAERGALKAQQDSAPEPSAGALPAYESAKIELKLSARQRRVGSEVFTRVTTAFDGRFVVEDPSGGQEPVELFFPFPLGTTEARDVLLEFASPTGRVEPEGVSYGRGGIRWKGLLPGGRLTVAAVSFVAETPDRFHYRLFPSRRLRHLSATLDASGAPAFSVPETALEPTSQSGRTLRWEAGNLVSDRAIIVDIPEAGSPISQVLRLFNLVGPAVLLFGAGFWYLCELREAGKLDPFRWWDFLLLAGNYSLFFVCFAVLGLKGQLGIAGSISLAAILSLPLLALHVARIVDARFALTRAVPLGAFTVGLMVSAVYGGAAREYVLLGGALAAVAYVTATVPRGTPRWV